MAEVSGKMYGVGARRAVIFDLNANGYPAATAPAHTPYEGVEVLGVKNFELSLPAVRKIAHVGNDRVLANDFLPATEGASASMTVAGRDLGLDALLSAGLEVTLGELKLLPQVTDNQGYEPDVAIFVCQQAKDATLRSRRYRAQVIPKCTIAAATPGMNENPAESKYEVSISPTSKHLWGLAFDPATDGCSEANIVEAMFEGRPNIVAWLGDNVETEFNLPADKPAVATGKIHAVYVDGVLDANPTLAVTTVTPTPKPTAGQIIVCIYEY